MNCKLCNKSILSLIPSPYGICNDCLNRIQVECSPIVNEIINKMNRFNNNGYKTEIKIKIAAESIELARQLIPYEQLGIPIMTPAPTVFISGLQKYIDDNTDNAEDVTPTSIPKAKKLLNTPYVVLDFETTGLSSKTDKIIEIGAVKVENGTIVNEFNTFVNPLRPVPDIVVRKTHIQDSDLINAPVIEFVIGRLAEFIGDNIIVAHNAPFDIGFYCAALGGSKETLRYIDTLKMSKKAFPDSKNHKLDTLAKELKLPRGSAHRALDDARCTQALYELCLKTIARANSEKPEKKPQTKKSAAEQAPVYKSLSEQAVEIIKSVKPNAECTVTLNSGVYSIFIKENGVLKGRLRLSDFMRIRCDYFDTNHHVFFFGDINKIKEIL